VGNGVTCDAASDNGDFQSGCLSKVIFNFST
jgi:hypothetical protein